MNRDILAELHNGSTSPEEAYSFYDKIMDSEPSSQVKELLGLRDPEWTAFCHGVGLRQLADWRYGGWPQLCARCKQPLNIEDYGWFAKQEKGETVIVHVACL